MPSLQAEVTGRYDHAGDANRLLYTPLPRALTARETRRYTVDYDGDGEALTAFLAKVLADPVSHELTTGEAPKFTGSSFILDYGMKGGALDLEKETILAHHRGDAESAFTIQTLRINRRLYVFDERKSGETPQLADRFVRDIVNPAIHTWKVTVPSAEPEPAPPPAAEEAAPAAKEPALLATASEAVTETPLSADTATEGEPVTEESAPDESAPVAAEAEPVPVEPELSPAEPVAPSEEPAPALEEAAPVIAASEVSPTAAPDHAAV
jgi:hypothetical protein